MKREGGQRKSLKRAKAEQRTQSSTKLSIIKRRGSIHSCWLFQSINQSISSSSLSFVETEIDVCSAKSGRVSSQAIVN